MAKSIHIGALSEEVIGVLKQYADDIADGTDEAAQKYAKQCRKDIQSAAKSQFGGTGKYAKGWSLKQTSQGRGKAGYTVYNRRPGLPHLLENGHAKVGGGRVSGRSHIKPAEEKATEAFQNAVEELIRNAGG